MSCQFTYFTLNHYYKCDVPNIPEVDTTKICLSSNTNKQSSKFKIIIITILLYFPSSSNIKNHSTKLSLVCNPKLNYQKSLSFLLNHSILLTVSPPFHSPPLFLFKFLPQRAKKKVTYILQIVAFTIVFIKFKMA